MLRQANATEITELVERMAQTIIPSPLTQHAPSVQSARLPRRFKAAFCLSSMPHDHDAIKHQRTQGNCYHKTAEVTPTDCMSIAQVRVAVAISHYMYLSSPLAHYGRPKATTGPRRSTARPHELKKNQQQFLSTNNFRKFSYSMQCVIISVERGLPLFSSHSTTHIKFHMRN